VNVATVQPPAGAGNVVFVLAPGDKEIVDPAAPGALIITIPEPPVPVLSSPGLVAPPPPPPVLAAPAVANPCGALAPAPPPPDPPAPPVPVRYTEPPPPPA
jgi:hypothetical protein